MTGIGIAYGPDVDDQLEKTFYGHFSSDGKNLNFPEYLKKVDPGLLRTNIAFCWGLPSNGRLGGTMDLSEQEEEIPISKTKGQKTNIF